MSIFQLVVKEISRRKINFLLALLSVTFAVAIFIGSLFMLKAHDLRTEKIIALKQAETEERMAVLQNDYRKIMKKLGFNLLILPHNQKLRDLYADDFASEYMPEAFVTKLSESQIITIRHLLPSLQQKIKWPERKRTIILIGTRGEVPFLHRDPKEPILVAVPKGHAVIGYELAASLDVRTGQTITLLGRDFVVTSVNEERGSRDDITIWIDLGEAQTLMNKEGQINAILALKCLCAGNEIAQIRSEIAAILPGVQVIEQGTKVVTRAEARQRAAREAKEALASVVETRRHLRAEQVAFSSLLVPAVLLICGIWIAFLFFSNVRERRSEIGILAAIGVRAKMILLLFVGKALLLAAVGAILGYVIGVVAVIVWRNMTDPFSWFHLPWFLLALLVATILALTASWIPAYLATGQDPAYVLREE